MPTLIAALLRGAHSHTFSLLLLRMLLGFGLERIPENPSVTERQGRREFALTARTGIPTTKLPCWKFPHRTRTRADLLCVSCARRRK